MCGQRTAGLPLQPKLAHRPRPGALSERRHSESGSSLVLKYPDCRNPLNNVPYNFWDHEIKNLSAHPVSTRLDAREVGSWLAQLFSVRGCWQAGRQGHGSRSSIGPCQPARRCGVARAFRRRCGSPPRVRGRSLSHSPGNSKRRVAAVGPLFGVNKSLGDCGVGGSGGWPHSVGCGGRSPSRSELCISKSTLATRRRRLLSQSQSIAHWRLEQANKGRLVFVGHWQRTKNWIQKAGQPTPRGHFYMAPISCDKHQITFPSAAVLAQSFAVAAFENLRRARLVPQ